MNHTTIFSADGTSRQLRSAALPDVEAAVSCAQELAKALNQDVLVSQDGDGWLVSWPPSPDEDEGTNPDDMLADDWDLCDAGDLEQAWADQAEEEQHEVIKPLLAEFADEQDAFARSEEDGWYYED